MSTRPPTVDAEGPDPATGVSRAFFHAPGTRDAGRGTGAGCRAGSVAGRAGRGGGPRAARLRRLAGPLGVLAVVLAGFCLVGTVDPHQPGHYPVCPLYQRTGILCPGCGGLRGAHSLAHGDLAAALSANALALVGYALLAVVLGGWTVRAVRGAPGDGPRGARAPAGGSKGRAGGGRGGFPGRLAGRLPAVSTRCRWALVVLVLVAFTVVRNLPCGAALRP